VCLWLNLQKPPDGAGSRGRSPRARPRRNDLLRRIDYFILIALGITFKAGYNAVGVVTGTYIIGGNERVLPGDKWELFGIRVVFGFVIERRISFLEKPPFSPVFTLDDLICQISEGFFYMFEELSGANKVFFEFSVLSKDKNHFGRK
jgi:hypothetical protein